MRKQKLQDEIKKFRDYVIKQSRSNLTKFKKNASKELYNSLKGTITEEGDNTDLVFTMLYYGDKWIVKRGISPRDKKGRFMTRKQVQFMIARGIFNKGIERSLFFTKPFADGYKRAGKDFQRALGGDLAIYLDEIIRESNKKRRKK